MKEIETVFDYINEKGITMETFEHNFETAFGVVDIAGIGGFTKCMGEVLKHIEKATEGDPIKRFIDSVPLTEKIKNTNKELAELLSNAAMELEREIKS